MFRLFCVLLCAFLFSISLSAQEKPALPEGHPSGRGARPLRPDQLLAEAIRLFQSEAINEIEAGFATLDYIQADEKLAPQLIEAATKAYKHDAAGISAGLLQKLVGLESEPIYAAIEETYEKFAGKPDALGAALRIFSEHPTKERNARLLKLLQKDCSKPANLGLVLYPYRKHQTFEPSFWMQLLSGYEQLDDRPALLLLALDLFQARTLTTESWADFLLTCTRRGSALLMRYQNDLDTEQPLLDGELDPDQISPSQQELSKVYRELEVLCDLFRFDKQAQSLELLKNMLQRQPSKLRAYAAISLLARGESVDALALEQIAGKPAARGLLWELLERERKQNLFPQKYYDQALLAEADLALWLVGPEGYGCVPEKLELLKVVEFQEERIHRDLYFFKFKYPGKELWHVGVAGAYLPKEPPRLKGLNTGSLFVKLSEKSLEEHIKDYLEKP